MKRFCSFEHPKQVLSNISAAFTPFPCAAFLRSQTFSPWPEPRRDVRSRSRDVDCHAIQVGIFRIALRTDRIKGNEACWSFKEDARREGNRKRGEDTKAKEVSN